MKRVLIVDDEDQVCELVRVLLDGVYETLKCSSGVSALNELVQHPDKVDLVLSDVHMPGFSGLQLVAAMREVGITVPVVLFSGYSPEDIPSHIPFLGKPFNKVDLLAKIEEALSCAESV